MAKSEPQVLVTMRKNFAHAEHGTCDAGKSIALPKSEAKKLVDSRQATPGDEKAEKLLSGKPTRGGSTSESGEGQGAGGGESGAGGAAGSA